MLESSQKLRELDLFERKLRLSPNGFLYNPLKFSLPDGDIAVIDDLFSFREYNNLMRHFAAAGAIGNPQPGVIQYYTGTKLWKGHDGVGWKEIFSENTPATGTGSIVRANAPTGVGQWTIPTIDLTGGQIAFPLDAVPSADPNTLDDYEEGTWTFGVSFGGGTTGITYNAGFVEGFYTKIGNVVTISGFIIMTSKGSDNGTALLTGLPLTVSDNERAFSSVSLRFDQVTFANVYNGHTIKNSTTISLDQTADAGASSVLTDGNFADNSRISVGATYRVA